MERCSTNTGLIFVPPLSEEAQDDIDNIAFINEVGETFDEQGLSHLVYKDGASLDIFQNTTDVTFFWNNASSRKLLANLDM